jgi:hypothetical protein
VGLTLRSVDGSAGIRRPHAGIGQGLARHPSTSRRDRLLSRPASIDLTPGLQHGTGEEPLIGIDTNVLVRDLTQDDAAQARKGLRAAYRLGRPSIAGRWKRS